MDSLHNSFIYQLRESHGSRPNYEECDSGIDDCDSPVRNSRYGVTKHTDDNTKPSDRKNPFIEPELHVRRSNRHITILEQAVSISGDTLAFQIGDPHAIWDEMRIIRSYIRGREKEMDSIQNL